MRIYQDLDTAKIKSTTNLALLGMWQETLRLEHNRVMRDGKGDADFQTAKETHLLTEDIASRITEIMKSRKAAHAAREAERLAKRQKA